MFSYISKMQLFPKSQTNRLSNLTDRFSSQYERKDYRFCFILTTICFIKAMDTMNLQTSKLQYFSLLNLKILLSVEVSQYTEPFQKINSYITVNTTQNKESKMNSTNNFFPPKFQQAIMSLSWILLDTITV